MAIRSTTSAHQPPPPFYGQHTTGAHRNVQRASEARHELGHHVGLLVVLGRKVDSAITVNPQITDSVTQTIVALRLGPPGL